ncbi:uncharacterized protein APUU_21417A [Aspergillus puulaauensis]|uniref:Autophagy-related protein Atg28 n=1 Tax=Aspergillus puulaauensis TaxID=1220207 RepID=A0A7R7XGQ9_9EURO|nr:uncharacterized protein APUU_21417A [Aspergillus puulaauensis]BCS20985.1 hypothetical protein APUU_21417A [Aspergillus puulaauensis]
MFTSKMSTMFPQNMSQSLVPLPLRTSPNYQDPLRHVERQARHIQRNLQHLIDAQSEGLLAGLGGQQPEFGTPNESNLSYSESVSSRGASKSPTRRLSNKKIGLRSAREGIFTSMYDLMRLREEELEILSYRKEEMNSGLNEIETFNTKRSGLEDAISTMNNDRETRRSRELRDESATLEVQIHELENKLAQMKSKHRHVVQELSQIENSVEAKMSSYKASLSLLENDIRKFLADPPVKAPARGTVGESFYSLKSNRRTLEMAQEHWKKEQSELQQRQNEIDAEIEALEEGGDVWKRVVTAISGFEGRLRTGMRRSIKTQEQLLKEDGAAFNKGRLSHDIMDDLSETTDLVELHLDHAEQKNWKLLVCCISAELQALREARQMLLSIFNITEEEFNPSPQGSPESRKSVDNDSQTDPHGDDNPDPPADLLRDAENHSHEAAKPGDEDEDDDPDPAWLLPET